MQDHLIEIWQRVDITIVFITHDLDEAITLARRVLVLKPNPGEIQALINVDLPCEQRETLVDSAAYRSLRAHIEQLIHEEEETDDLPMNLPRYTRV